MTYPQINKESVVNNSIKKFFVDNVAVAEGVYVVFDRTMSPPTQDDVSKWLYVEMYDYAPGHLNRKMVYIYCFTKNDLEGVDLSNLVDVVMKYLHEGQMPIYDDDLITVIGGALLTVDPISRMFTTKDRAKARYIPITLTWGGVW